MSPVALDPEESVRAELDGATLYDISYASSGGGRVSGWMVVPASEGPHAGIVYVHGSETDRDDFLDEATALATGGAVTLTLNAPFARTGDDRTGTLGNYFSPDAEADLNQQMLDDVSDAIDLLAARDDVDAARLGVVGHDFGGMIAAVEAADEDRLKALVIVAATPRWADWFLPFWDIAEDRIDYLRAMRPLDPIELIGRAVPATVLFQFGRSDFFMAAMSGLEFRAAAPAGTELLPYDTGHDMRSPEIAADRRAFLVRTLGLRA